MATRFKEIGGEGDRRRISACQEQFLFAAAPVGVSKQVDGWRMLCRRLLLLYRGASRSAMVLGCRDRNGVAHLRDDGCTTQWFYLGTLRLLELGYQAEVVHGVAHNQLALVVCEHVTKGSCSGDLDPCLQLGRNPYRVKLKFQQVDLVPRK